MVLGGNKSKITTRVKKQITKFDLAKEDANPATY
jgi:hypothetical protein